MNHETPDLHAALAPMPEAERVKLLAAIGARAAALAPESTPSPTPRHERRRYAALARRSQTR